MKVRPGWNDVPYGVVRNSMTDSTRLAADTAMGPVTLDVADLDAMTGYYRDAVGLSVLDATGPVVTLGLSLIHI